jgi:hypothetical protein
MPFDEKKSTGAKELPHNVLQLAKRRRAILESTPSRNSQMETHSNDETEASAFGPASSSDG